MSSFFQGLWAGLQPAFDGPMGEPVRFEPQADGELVVVGADPNRPVRTDLVGIFDDKIQVTRPVGSGANTHETADITVEQTQIDFAIAQFATPADRPKEADVLVLTARDGAPRYQVDSAEPDNFSRLICIVAPL